MKICKQWGGYDVHQTQSKDRLVGSQPQCQLQWFSISGVNGILLSDFPFICQYIVEEKYIRPLLPRCKISSLEDF